MTRDVKKTVRATAACLALILLVAIGGMILRPPAPLTAAEKRLVGNWNKIELPGEGVVFDMTFTADRVFHANDGQFVGRWSISGGQLHIKYGRGDWREDWSNWLPHNLWSALSWRDEANLNIRFIGGGKRVELADPGEHPSRALVRVE
jgi:hypothetical protein